MKTTNSNPMTEHELDELINHSFLNASAHHIPPPIMEKIATHALRATQAPVSIKKILSVIGALTSIAIVTAWLVRSADNPNRPPEQGQKASATLIQSSIATPAKSSIEITVNPAPRSNLPARNIVVADQKQENSTLYLTPDSPQLTGERQEGPFVMIDQQPNHQTEAYVFPVLTEKEIKYNEKQKKRLVRLAYKLGKSYFPKISGNPAAGDYYLMSLEVTNLSYRTFLFDLLLSNRKEEFLKAKPDQDLWLNAAGQTCFNQLAQLYFSDPKYNDHPVVNISVEGAELYCRWLSEEVNKYARSEGSTEQRTYTLPTEQEWLYGAEGGRKNAMYPWPHDSVQNRANCFMANCCIQKLKDKITKPICNNHMKVDESCYTSGGMMLRDSTIATVLVGAYNPNAYGLFTMSGNVSELVYKNKGASVKTMGGNWASDFEHLKLNSEDEFEGGVKPSPMIGFRVMVRRN